MTSNLLAMTAVTASIMPSYVMGWGSLSLINAGLAQSKNHSGMVWWIVSLMLGPVATLIIVAFLDKNEPPMMKFYDDFQ